MLFSHLQKINRPSSPCPPPCPDEPATQEACQIPTYSGHSGSGDPPGPHKAVRTQDQETQQGPKGQLELRIRRPNRSPQDSGDSGSGDPPSSQGSGHSRKRVGLGVSVTEKDASVTHEGPFSFGDLHY